MEMDPISCTYLSSTKQNLCWVNTGTNKMENGFGSPFTFFPLIQHYSTDCNTCSDVKDRYCDTVDLVYLLFFDESEWSGHHYIKSAGIYGADDFTWIRTGYPGDDDYKVLWSRGGGNTGVIVLNNYYGVKFLNDLKYPMPKNLHCTSNVLSLPKAQGAVKDEMLANLKIPPTKLQELYFKCRYSTIQCVSQGIAAGSGYANLVNTFFIFIFGYIAACAFGIPTGEFSDAQLRINETEKNIAEFRAEVQREILDLRDALGLKQKRNVETRKLKPGSEVEML